MLQCITIENKVKENMSICAIKLHLNENNVWHCMQLEFSSIQGNSIQNSIDKK
jgi:hypothetical protein